MTYLYKGGYIAIVKDQSASIQRLADLRKYYNGMTYGTYQKHFNKIVLPEYIDVLKKYGQFEAQKISRTGELQSNVITGRGKATRGYPSVWLGASGPAAKYASIINEGGWQKKKKKYLTIPLNAAKDANTGAKIKSVREYPSDTTFLMVPTNASAWGRLAGQLVLFEKHKTFPSGKPRGTGDAFKRGSSTARGNGSKGSYFHKIIPIFIYATENYVKPTHWATNALKRSKVEAIKMIREYNINFANRGKRGVMSR